MQLRIFSFQLRIFKMSFCSAGLLLLLFPLHTKTEHSWGGTWGVGKDGEQSGGRQASWVGVPSQGGWRHCWSQLRWNHIHEWRRMVSEWYLPLVHCHYVNLDQGH